MKEKQSQGFEANYKKLEQFAKELQENKVSIDELVPRMKDALQSITICKDVLRETKSQLTEINKAFEELEQS